MPVPGQLFFGFAVQFVPIGGVIDQKFVDHGCSEMLGVPANVADGIIIWHTGKLWIRSIEWKSFFRNFPDYESYRPDRCGTDLSPRSYRLVSILVLMDYE